MTAPVPAPALGGRSVGPVGRLVLAASAIFLAVFVYDGVLRPLVRPIAELPPLAGGISRLTVVLFVSSVLHAAFTIGPRHMVAFLAISAVVSWAFEQAGVETGLVYGRYHYTDVLGAKVGHVPILIPIAWFTMIWPSHVMANLIATGRPLAPGRRLGVLAWLALLGAFVMTAWDLVVDPILSGPEVRAWIWEDGGPYFGIPAQNYLGWLATTFTVYLAYRLLERSWPPRPMGPLSRRAMALALGAYGAMLAANLQAGGAPEALVVIGPFAMGLPLLAALGRLLALDRDGV